MDYVQLSIGQLL